ncbi:hypothetical protein H5410_024976 [Solanum commersonii]|uniref:Uncharacterized protein n=1 Tax=Solanum commersonii TaxID=4109 RepID=A0A9J5YWM2_SOLCO|nr:hypothetical protein H5410_024976 [Solanum commersonii]
MSMLRQMCGHTRSDRIRKEEIRDKVEMQGSDSEMDMTLDRTMYMKGEDHSSR